MIESAHVAGMHGRTTPRGLESMRAYVRNLQRRAEAAEKEMATANPVQRRVAEIELDRIRHRIACLTHEMQSH